MSKRVTIQDVAAQAGVSYQTVSRVINNRPDVASATRRRVQQVIDELGFRPSSIARGMASGRSYILGVISASLEYFGPARMLMGVEKQASKLGYTIILRAIHDPDHFDIDEHLSFFLSQRVDGIIWTAADTAVIRKAILKKIPQLEFPVVFNNIEPHPDLNVVDFDSYDGSRMATEHLIAQGCQSIGLITGPMQWCVARQRYRGWKEALEAAGYAAPDEHVVEGDWSAISGEKGMVKLLEQQPEIDALFASNDPMALGAIKAAKRLGLRVPEDLAVVGYDDVPEADFFAPPLTTVRHDLESLAGLAVKEIDHMIDTARNGEDSYRPGTHLLKPELIIRESSIKSHKAVQNNQR